jgi:hypothetical protein
VLQRLVAAVAAAVAVAAAAAAAVARAVLLQATRLPPLVQAVRVATMTSPPRTVAIVIVMVTTI